MERVTFPDDQVQQKLKEVEPVALDIDLDDNAELRRRYGDVGVPSFAMVDARGDVVHRWVGALEPHGFVAELELGIARHGDPSRRQRDAALDALLDACESGDPFTIRSSLRRLEPDEAKHVEALPEALWSCCERARERRDTKQWTTAAEHLLARVGERDRERAEIEHALARFEASGATSALLDRHIDQLVAVLAEPLPGSGIADRMARLLGRAAPIDEALAAARSDWVDRANDTMERLGSIGRAAAPALRRGLLTMPAASQDCAVVLGRMRLPDTVSLLREELTDERLPSWARSSIVSCIGAHKNPADLALLAEHAAADQPLRVRSAAIWALRDVLQQLQGQTPTDATVAAALGDALHAREPALLTAALQTMYCVHAALPLDALVDTLDDDRPLFADYSIGDNALWILLRQLGSELVDAEGEPVAQVTPEVTAFLRQWLAGHAGRLRWSDERGHYVPTH